MHTFKSKFSLFFAISRVCELLVYTHCPVYIPRLALAHSTHGAIHRRIKVHIGEKKTFSSRWGFNDSKYNDNVLIHIYRSLDKLCTSHHMNAPSYIGTSLRDFAIFPLSSSLDCLCVWNDVWNSRMLRELDGSAACGDKDEMALHNQKILWMTFSLNKAKLYYVCIWGLVLVEWKLSR